MKIPEKKSQVSQTPESSTPAVESGPLTLLSESSLPVVFSTPATDLMVQIKTPYPVEIGKTVGVVMTDCYKVGLYDGKTFTVLPVPYTMVMIKQRNASRVFNTADSFYIRAYAGGASDQLYQDQCRADPKARGITSAVAVISDKGIAICEMATFGPAESYWARPLGLTGLKGRVGMKVDLLDHSPNLTVSKTTGHAYLDPKKFRSHSQVQLSQEQVALVLKALEASWPQVQAWQAQ